jgi:signal transduction histidine kinase
MVTALNDRESVDRAFAAGATDYITKPIHWAVLRQRMRRLLQVSWAMEELRQQTERERQALAKEKELNELRSRFITVASHEFRTPLTAILSAAELLEHYSHKHTENKKLSYLHRIQNSVHHMTDLLNDVLLIAKSEAGKIEFNPTPIELVKFCQELTEEIQLSYGNRHLISFISCCTFPAPIPGNAPACMDEKLLRHILSNLLSNAIKYSPPGSAIYFRLALADGTAKEGEREGEGEGRPKRFAVFEIQDSGMGIPPEDRPRLFESFHRANNVGTIPGTGLGLAIVKNSVNIHGGEISVNSEVGAGTTFTVKLPLNYQPFTSEQNLELDNEAIGCPQCESTSGNKGFGDAVSLNNANSDVTF